VTGTIVAVVVAGEGARVRAGEPIVVVEAMKMEQPVTAPVDGVIARLAVRVGDGVVEGQIVARVQPEAAPASDPAPAPAPDGDAIRADLAEALARTAALDDAHRPDAMARRRAAGQRSARANLADLCDPGSAIEYGGLALAAQRLRRPIDELIRDSPADGLICVIATIDGAPAMVLAYDYTVMAGTQGGMGHKKLDRMLALARERRLPIVLFAEGGGGRPNDSDMPQVSGLDTPSFFGFAALSGLVPRIGIVSGRCFAGNAALAGCCDVLIATENANLGMAGPAMVEGGGLGRFPPEAIGPIAVQSANGVVDVRVADEAAAVAIARRVLGLFGAPRPAWTAPDQRPLRNLVPENRKRDYDVRAAVATLLDDGSAIELRAGFGAGIVTTLGAIEGRTVAVLANNPRHLGGAIDADAADKAARFMQLADAFDVPLVSLCDTPGFMVGPDAEKTGLVRHVARLFLAGASVDVPRFTVVLRKGYGLGAQAMAGGHFHAPFFTVSWPSGELGAMGLEGAARLGLRRELAAIADPAEREARTERAIAAAYARGKALNVASVVEIDAVIDPAETRSWLARGLRSCPPPAPRPGRKRMIDSW
jgi:acetyl-CoA carboxylase carboxyltransferase component